MISLYIEPYLDKKCKQYKSIVTLDQNPPGPLAQRTKLIRIPALSEFRSEYESSCKYAVLNEYNEYIDSAKLPQLLTYLVSNNYIIDYNLTKLLKNHSKKIVCTFIYQN